MGVNPVPDNILTPRSGSRTTLPRTPLPTPRARPHMSFRCSAPTLTVLMPSSSQHPSPSPVGATLVVAR